VLAADIRALLPPDAEPAQVFEHGGGKFRLRALRVQVFVAHYEYAPGLQGTLVSHPKGLRVAKVQEAGW
jgi:hypothetical protein